ncbi:MAG: hypothetical protein O3A81_02630 [bacterium]|nr:hypothetical protein [bacterium]
MKLFLIKSCSAFFITALLVTTIPSSAYAARGTLRKTETRCENTAGRENIRCKYVNSKTERLRYSNSRNGYLRTHTLRERRHVSKNRPSTDIRRIGSEDLARIRRHNRDGGNARRLINRRDENARAKCESLESTAKYMCIRAQTRASNRGETR